mmetsp:Transcript_40734/g.68206  ORF Transcript_40734/g.68206 Transcript_40734/m.68206 type:complete len:492 (-) Transcript_40734:238-1713(-)|eukprot:CAMPEP_0198208820 /NCGR_PEP_ID=MMETSP1445-20131203/12160_1 /TAXON_ID=36898 /ORGANISM="Pyramimonas sp., Strain CCMP2087" /LENGTH=491 /DNA_ID=CAMNT_0043882371 /DNA_START=84 /DNA_END=1559 /DNA_ORIENTATION=+
MISLAVLVATASLAILALISSRVLLGSTLFKWLGSIVRFVVGKSIATGPVPRHVAIIMDGNRRYALSRNIDKLEGHAQGYERLIDALGWCLDLGIEVVSVYAFSVENFKRSQQEVDALMELAALKLRTMLRESFDMLERHQVSVRVIGDLDRLPRDVQRAAAEVMIATAHHKRAALNICLAYTGRQDMLQAMEAVQEGVASGVLAASDTSLRVFERCLHTAEAPPVALLIRTSGETRLSDFMTWQCAHATLAFLEVLWPDFSFWDLVGALILYQRACYQTVTKTSVTKPLPNRYQTEGREAGEVPLAGILQPGTTRVDQSTAKRGQESIDISQRSTEVGQRCPPEAECVGGSKTCGSDLSRYSRLPCSCAESRSEAEGASGHTCTGGRAHDGDRDCLPGSGKGQCDAGVVMGVGNNGGATTIPISVEQCRGALPPDDLNRTCDTFPTKTSLGQHLQWGFADERMGKAAESFVIQREKGFAKRLRLLEQSDA